MHNQATTTKPKKECACYAKIWCEICKNSQCNDGYYVAAIQPIPIKHGSESSQSGLSAKHLKHLDHQALMHSILSICYDYPIYIHALLGCLEMGTPKPTGPFHYPSLKPPPDRGLWFWDPAALESPFRPGGGTMIQARTSKKQQTNWIFQHKMGA